MVLSQTLVPARWLENHQRGPNPVLRLFCLPFAGGSASLFATWLAGLPAGVELCPIQLPGRGTRLAERADPDLLSLADRITTAIAPSCAEPFAMIGHSMGGLLGFEVSRRLETRHGLIAEHLILSAALPPHERGAGPVTYDLPDPELLTHLRELNGTPPELLDNLEIRSWMLPLIRADFRAVQTYRYAEGQPVRAPITVITGTQDPRMTEASAQGWRAYTTGPFVSRVIEGDHFLITRQQRAYLQIVSDVLLPICNRLRP